MTAEMTREATTARRFEDVEIYYLLEEGSEKERGPYSLKDLRELWIIGEAHGAMLYATEGMSKWKPLGELRKEMFFEPSTPTPPTVKELALMTCPDCGGEVSKRANACPKCGAPIAAAATPAASGIRSRKERWVYIVLGILVGGIGVHNFYAGRVGVGLVQLAIALVLGWLVFPLLALWAWSLWEVFTVERDGMGLMMR